MTSKIPPAEWDAIATRRDNGESVAYIARTYETSPATIYGILKKVAEAKGTAPEVPAAEPTPAPTAPAPRAPVESAPVAKAPEPAAPASEPAPRPAPSRLSLNVPGQARPPVNQPVQAAPAPAQPAAERAPSPAPQAPGPQAPAPQPAATAPAQPAAPFRFTYENRAVEPPPRQPRQPMAPRPFAQPEPKTALNANLDAELRSQADAAVAVFQAAFEAVLASETAETRKELRQAASDLMRVAARTTIALERKDAAVDRAALPAQRYRNEPLPAEQQQGDFRHSRRPPRN
jgi:hypothetical protein